MSGILHNTRFPIYLNTLRPRQNGRHFADDMFKCIFLNKNVWIPIEISLKFVPTGSINNNPALLQIVAWRRPGDKPLSEPMMVCSLTHVCVTRPQWVNPSPFQCFTFLKDYMALFGMVDDFARNILAQDLDILGAVLLSILIKCVMAMNTTCAMTINTAMQIILLQGFENWSIFYPSVSNVATNEINRNTCNVTP